MTWDCLIQPKGENGLGGVKYEVSTYGGLSVSLGGECPDGYRYLIARMPWLKSKGRRCSCSEVN